MRKCLGALMLDMIPGNSSPEERASLVSCYSQYSRTNSLGADASLSRILSKDSLFCLTPFVLRFTSSRVLPPACQGFS